MNGIIRHMDHKNVVHDPTVKSCVVQVAANVARQIRSVASLSDVGCISDLLRHLRKSLQSIAGPIGEEANLNIHLQNSIESCLLEIAKGVSPIFWLVVMASFFFLFSFFFSFLFIILYLFFFSFQTRDADSLFFFMVIALEKLPSVGVVARATLGSVLILAHVSVAVYSHLQLVNFNVEL